MKKRRRTFRETIVRFLWFFLLDVGLVGAVCSMNEIDLVFRIVMAVLITLILALFFLERPSDGPPPYGGLDDVGTAP